MPAEPKYGLPAYTAMAGAVRIGRFAKRGWWHPKTNQRPQFLDSDSPHPSFRHAAKGSERAGQFIGPDRVVAPIRILGPSRRCREERSAERMHQDGPGNGRPMSDNAILAAMRRMGIGKDEMSGHGFRAVARTILDEVLGFRPDYIEHQLAHAVRDPNGRPYNRTAHLPERRRMMQQWADYLDDLVLAERSSLVNSGERTNFLLLACRE